jgi:tetrahydromethanopterin S-methyltransferase subunit B
MEEQMISNEKLHETLLEIKSDVKTLRATKVDQAIHVKDLEILELKLAPIRADVSAIKGYVKWVAFTIIGGVGVSIMNLVLTSPK